MAMPLRSAGFLAAVLAVLCFAILTNPGEWLPGALSSWWVRLPGAAAIFAGAAFLIFGNVDIGLLKQKNTRATSQDASLSGPVTIIVLCAVLLALLAYVVYALFMLWPTPDLLSSACILGGPDCRPPPVSLLLIDRVIDAPHPNIEHRLMAIVGLAGCLGAYVHASTSLSDYVGNRDLRRSWTIWLFMRVPIGGALALIMYFVLRGIGALSLTGFVAVGPTGAAGAGTTLTALQVNPFAFAGIGALTGMFAKQATDKLAEIFDTLLQSAVRRADALSGRAPAIVHLVPDTITAGRGDTDVAIRGVRFKANSTITAGGQVQATNQFTSETEMKVTLARNLLTAAGKIAIAVVDPDEGPSRPKEVSIVPRPEITGFRPPAVPIGGDRNVVVVGAGFRDGATVTIDGAQVPTASIAANEIVLTLPANLLGAQAARRDVPIVVISADGVPSDAKTLTITP